MLLCLRDIVAISQAKPSDTILIAGKGHEDYQILGTKKIHFDDREEAQAALAQRLLAPKLCSTIQCNQK